MSSSEATSESKPEEATVECFSDLPTPQRKKICAPRTVLQRKTCDELHQIRLMRSKVVRALFPTASFATRPGGKKKKTTRTHRKRREELKKKARAPNTSHIFKNALRATKLFS